MPKSIEKIIDPQRNRVQYDIAPIALFKIVAAALIVFVVIRLFTLGLLVFLGFLLAVSLDPLVQKLRRKGLSKGISIAIMASAITGVIGLVAFVLIPSIFDQVLFLIKVLPNLKAGIIEHLAEENIFRNFLIEMFQNPQIPATDVLMGHTLALLNGVFQGLTEVFLVLIFSIYLLIDGKRAFKWICDFFSAPVRAKLQATARETFVLVFGYVTGQVVTSVISAIFSYAVLTVLHVPGALTLATLAGIFDILPVLGFFLAVIPAVVLALTVSPSTALTVLGLYVAYHALESYFITPVVYGNSLKVSPLVVLLALLVAGILTGILGAIAVLPLVASYPIVERIWLAKYLGDHVVDKHAEDTDVMAVAEQVKLWNERLINLSRNSSSQAERQLVKGLGKTILFCEDDPDIRSTLKEILENEGYTVLAVSNGKDGIDVLHHSPEVGLILLDMQMPVMDGRTFLNLVKKEEAYRHIPVIFLSANADEKSSEGAAGFLRKPAELNTVLDVVSQHYPKFI